MAPAKERPKVINLAELQQNDVNIADLSVEHPNDQKSAWRFGGGNADKTYGMDHRRGGYGDMGMKRMNRGDEEQEGDEADNATTWRTGPPSGSMSYGGGMSSGPSYGGGNRMGGLKPSASYGGSRGGGGDVDFNRTEMRSGQDMESSSGGFPSAFGGGGPRPQRREEYFGDRGAAARQPVADEGNWRTVAPAPAKTQSMDSTAPLKPKRFNFNVINSELKGKASPTSRPSPPSQSSQKRDASVESSEAMKRTDPPKKMSITSLQEAAPTRSIPSRSSEDIRPPPRMARDPSIERSHFSAASQAPFQPKVLGSKGKAPIKLEDLVDSAEKSKIKAKSHLQEEQKIVAAKEIEKKKKRKNEKKTALLEARIKKSEYEGEGSRKRCVEKIRKNLLKGCAKDIDTICGRLEPVIASKSPMAVDEASKLLDTLEDELEAGDKVWESTLLLACIHVLVVKEIAAIAEDIMEQETFEDLSNSKLEEVVDSKLRPEAVNCVKNADPLLLALSEKMDDFLGNDFQYVNFQELTRSLAKSGCPRLTPSLTLTELILLAWQRIDSRIVTPAVILEWYDDPFDDETEGRASTLSQMGQLVSWLRGDAPESLDSEADAEADSEEE